MQTNHNHTRWLILSSSRTHLAYMAACIFLCLLMLPTTSARAAEPLRLALSQTPLSLPFYVAERQGYFEMEGVKVTINEVIGGHRSFQQIMEGTADLATSSEAVVMFNSFKNRDFAVIASFVSSYDDVKVLTGADTGITDARQLAGKRVGTVVGSASHYYLETVLTLNGVNPKSVQLRNLQPEAMAEALKKRDVDAIAIWEPFPFKTLQSIPGSKVLPKSAAYRLTFNLLVHRKHLGKRDNDLVRLLRAIDRAQLFIATQPEKAKAILRDRLRLDQAFIDWIWPRYSFKTVLDQSLLTTLEGEARWARQEGLVKGDRSPNYLDFIYTAPLSKVKPTAVTIIK